MAAKSKNSIDKYLYKVVLYLIKTIPTITSIIFLLNTILSYFNIELEVFSHICGVSLFTILFFYLTSIAFRFCVYHRMFIHYITLNWILNLYDYYIGIPTNNLKLLYIYLIITGIFLFIILYTYKYDRCSKKTTCKNIKRYC